MRSNTLAVVAALSALLLPVLSFYGCAPPAHSKSDFLGIKPVVIGNDDGGVLDEYIKWYERLLDAHVPVKIDGVCISACTNVHLLPPEQVCITHRSSLGYHLASMSGTALKGYSEAWFRYTYPQVVLDYIYAQEKFQGPMSISNAVFIQADQLIAWGVFREC